MRLYVTKRYINLKEHDRSFLIWQLSMLRVVEPHRHVGTLPKRSHKTSFFYFFFLFFFLSSIRTLILGVYLIYRRSKVSLMHIHVLLLHTLVFIHIL